MKRRIFLVTARTDKQRSTSAEGSTTPIRRGMDRNDESANLYFSSNILRTALKSAV